MRRQAILLKQAHCCYDDESMVSRRAVRCEERVIVDKARVISCRGRRIDPNGQIVAGHPVKAEKKDASHRSKVGTSARIQPQLGSIEMNGEIALLCAIVLSL